MESVATEKTFTVRVPNMKPGRATLRDWWTLTKKTAHACLQHRMAGLAGEAAFFTLISMPPLLLGLVGTIGYLMEVIGPDTVGAVRFGLVRAAATVLSPEAIDRILQPVLDEVLGSGRAGVISIGFILALWSGSTALNVYIDTISVVYGLAGRRHFVRQRLMSAVCYLAGLIGCIVLLPLLAIGPAVAAQLLPEASGLVHLLYWPVIAIGSIAFLTTLYSLSVPLRTPWREHLPGAALALVVWLLGSLGLRVYLDVSISHSPLYGTLAAPMGILWWLYITAFAVLLGAALNSELDGIRPQRGTAQARQRLPG